MTRLRLMMVGILATLALQPGDAAPRRAVSTNDWTATATVAPGGGFVLGNPRAPVRLVEYASFTCPHCAVFAGEGWPALTPRLRSGKLALEVRTAVRDRFDTVAAMLARCRGPSRYFDISKELFESQAEWLTRAATWESGGENIDKLAPADALLAMAKGAGFDTMLAPHGYTPAVMRACLADPRVQKPVEAMSAEAWQQRRITGTPAFMINDRVVEAHDWATLRPLLDAALK